MANFSDEEDKELFQLARKYVDAGWTIRWDTIATKMRHTKKKKEVLRGRFSTLKITYGKDLSKFPRRFFAPVKPRRKKKNTKMTIQASESLLMLSSLPKKPPPVLVPSLPKKSPPFNMLKAFDALLSALQNKTREDKSPSTQDACEAPLDKEEAYEAVDAIFESVVKKTVLHSGKDIHLNTGELSFDGVSALIESIGDISTQDRFLDIGSGLGNVVTQVALQTKMKRSIGVEIRRSVANLGKKLIEAKCCEMPRLKKVQIIAEDMCDVDLLADEEIKETTVLFSSNKLFLPATNLAMERVICDLKNLRYVFLGQPFCQRHTKRCCKEFCLLWVLCEEIKVDMTWTSTEVMLYKYKLRFT